MDYSDIRLASRELLDQFLPGTLEAMLHFPQFVQNPEALTQCHIEDLKMLTLCLITEVTDELEKRERRRRRNAA